MDYLETHGLITTLTELLDQLFTWSNQIAVFLQTEVTIPWFDGAIELPIGAMIIGADFAMVFLAFLALKLAISFIK